MSQPITLTDAKFDEQVLPSGTPVLVDYWAPWCGPSRQLSTLPPRAELASRAPAPLGRRSVTRGRNGECGAQLAAAACSVR
jgi:thiol-disulfide isomerase/thioredoxin